MCHTHESHRRAAAEAGAIPALLTSLDGHKHSAPAATAVLRALAAVLGGGGRAGRDDSVAVHGSMQSLEAPHAGDGLRRKREVVEGGGVGGCVEVVREHAGDASAVSAAGAVLMALSCACARSAALCRPLSDCDTDPSLVFAGMEARPGEAPSAVGGDDDAEMVASDMRLRAADLRGVSGAVEGGVCAEFGGSCREEVPGAELGDGFDNDDGKTV